MWNEKLNMIIIGGTKGLGKWIAEHLRSDFNITITNRNETSGIATAGEINVNYNNDNIEGIKNAGNIIFCVPIEFMSKMITEVAPHAPEGSLLMMLQV